jgi:hypothetical protein
MPVMMLLLEDLAVDEDAVAIEDDQVEVLVQVISLCSLPAREEGPA